MVTLLRFGLFIVTSVCIEKWSGDALVYLNSNCFVQRRGEKIFRSQCSINVIFPSVSADDVQAERHEQTQPKAGSQLCWSCNCWWITFSRAGSFPRGWPSQGKSVLLVTELINAGRTFKNVEAPGDFILVILPVNAAPSPSWGVFTARWGARAHGKHFWVLCAGGSARRVSGISSGMSQVPQITLSVLLCLQHAVKFLAGRSRLSETFLVFWKKNRGVSEQLHFMLFDVILFTTEWINAQHCVLHCVAKLFFPQLPVFTFNVSLNV